ncbi:MFS transporter [Actinomycetes bacterium KLBMP 9759]
MTAGVDAAPVGLSTRRGKAVLVLLCTVAFLDFVDASIVNVALPVMGEELGFTVAALQWVPSGYLLTYGGFMLLGGRAADLLGRRRVLVAGTLLFAVSSVAGGLADSAGVMVGARLVQGAGAALMLPATLSILTTTFRGADRHTALGIWGAVSGGASAIGVLAGGLLTAGPGWRWVMLVNPPICVLVLVGIAFLVADDRRSGRLADADLPGAALVTGGMLLLVYGLVTAPTVGWASIETLGGLAGAVAMLAAFAVHERRSAVPLLPPSILRIPGLVAADVTQLIAAAGFTAMFFFLTLYMESVLGYTPLQTGLAYLPLCVGVGIGSTVAGRITARAGARTVVVTGLLVAAVGLALLSRLAVDGTYVTTLLPGMAIASIGLGMVFVAVTTAANAGVPHRSAGLAAALINASQQLGAAVGLAVFTAMATSRTSSLLAAQHPEPAALTSGFQLALLGAAVALVAASLVGLRVRA